MIKNATNLLKEAFDKTMVETGFSFKENNNVKEINNSISLFLGIFEDNVNSLYEDYTRELETRYIFQVENGDNCIRRDVTDELLDVNLSKDDLFYINEYGLSLKNGDHCICKLAEETPAWIKDENITYSFWSQQDEKKQN